MTSNKFMVFHKINLTNFEYQKRLYVIAIIGNAEDQRRLSNLYDHLKNII